MAERAGSRITSPGAAFSTGSPAYDLNARQFAQVRSLAYEQFGLDLRQGKEGLVAARLGKKVREGRFRSFDEYFSHVLADPTGLALVEMIDALTTNHTSFLRERAHFDLLENEIVPWLAARGTIEIWSAACSTGEEPYSVMFCVLNKLAAKPVAVQLLATDISTRVLATAQKGMYPAARVAGLPPAWVRAFLLNGQGEWRGWYQVKPEVRNRIEFRRLNLIEPFPFVKRFHVIFCRNVMIYFDRATQEGLVNRLAERLEPGGYLLIGHSESLTGIQHPLQYLAPAVYRKAAIGGRR